MPKIDQFLTAEEVAKTLKLHPYTIRRLCREEKIPCFKFGGQWRFEKKQIDQYFTNKECSVCRGKSIKHNRVKDNKK